MKQRIMSAGLAGLLLAGGMVAGVATPASAHTPAASATCEALDISAQYYETKPGTPAVGEPQITIDNPDYVAAIPGTPAVGEPTIKVEKPNPDYKPEQAATYETVVTDREYKKLKVFWWDYQWFPETAKPNPNSGWIATGNTKTKQIEKTPYVPAQDTPTILVDEPNPAYVPATPDQPAQGEPTIVVDNPEYTPATEGDSTPNTVTATIDGVEVLSDSFGESYSETIPFENKYVAHDWSVTITAWNDPDGSNGWTKTISGTTTPCEEPETSVSPANPTASLTAICGSATMILTNPLINDAEQLTASFIAEVDGEFYDAYSVMAGGREEVVIDFDEDSGDHTIEVFQAGTSEWKSIAKGTVPSDCEVPPTEEPEEPTKPEEPTTPTTPDKVTPVKVTSTQVKAAAVAPTTDTLAATGADGSEIVWGLTGGALAIALGALAIMLGMRRRQVKNETE